MSALNKKLITVIILMFSVILTLQIKSFALVNPTKNFYVNDYANILDEEVEEYIIQTNQKLETATGAQIVVVTVQNLENESLEQYATDLFREFGIGDKTKNNGVLLLLALEERQFRIEVGYGLEGVLTDGKTGRIQDEYIIPYLKQNNWNEGVKNGYSKILEEVSNEYQIDAGGMSAVSQQGSSMNFISAIFPFGLILISIFNMFAKKIIKIIVLIIDIISMIFVVFLLISNPSTFLMSIFTIQIMLAIYTIIMLISKGRRWHRFLWRRRLFLWRKWLFRWWIFWRRRFFWRRWLIKKFLKK